MVVPPQRNHRGGLVSFGRVRAYALRAGVEASHFCVVAPDGWWPTVSVRGVASADRPPNDAVNAFAAGFASAYSTSSGGRVCVW